MLALLILNQGLVADLDAILEAPQLKGAIVAALVVDASGKTLYDRNADIRIIPASNQKLLSVAFALHELGPEFRPRTRFWKQNERIVIEATGDPVLSFAQLVDARTKLGVTVQGKNPVYIKQAYRPLVPPSWEWDDLPNKYAAPVTALTVDRGSFEIWAENGKAIFVPDAHGTAIWERGTGLGEPRIDYLPERKLAMVYGKLPEKRTRLDTLALPEPDKAAGAILGSPVLTAASVPERDPDHIVVGPDLAHIAKLCLAPSDNNIAEHLLLMAASNQGDLPDRPYAMAQQRLKTFLVKTVGLTAEDVNPSDGSGMSRHNNVTARGIVKVLRWADTQSWSKVWHAALARPGSGTLATRLQGSTFTGKTGTLNLASALSGYVRDSEGGTLMVSLVFNHYLGSSSDVRAIQDAFIKRLEKRTTGESTATSHDGTLFARLVHYEGRFSENEQTAAPFSNVLEGGPSAHARHRASHRDRIHRSHHDRDPARERPDRRDEPPYEGHASAERVALRAR